MYAAARNRISNEKAFELMKDKVVYILGTLPVIEMKDREKFGFDIIKRKAENGDKVPDNVYLTAVKTQDSPLEQNVTLVIQDGVTLW